MKLVNAIPLKLDLRDLVNNHVFQGIFLGISYPPVIGFLRAFKSLRHLPKSVKLALIMMPSSPAAEFLPYYLPTSYAAATRSDPAKSRNLM